MNEPGYNLIAESLARIEGRVERIDVALRGGLGTDEPGLIARHSALEAKVDHLRSDHFQLREAVEAPKSERRNTLHGILIGGVGGAMAAAFAWVGSHLIGK